MHCWRLGTAFAGRVGCNTHVSSQMTRDGWRNHPVPASGCPALCGADRCGGGGGRCGRERKKAKATDLEKTVAALADQLGSMEGVRAENATLQDKNLALVSQLRAREEELERMLREQAPPLPLP